MEWRVLTPRGPRTQHPELRDFDVEGDAAAQRPGDETRLEYGNVSEASRRKLDEATHHTPAVFVAAPYSQTYIVSDLAVKKRDLDLSCLSEERWIGNVDTQPRDNLDLMRWICPRATAQSF